MTVFLVFFPGDSANGPVSVRPDKPRGRTGSLQNQISALVPFLTFLNSPANLVLGIFLLDPECAGDLVGSGSHQPVIKVLIPLCMAISFPSFATTVNSKGAVDRPKGRALNWYV